MKEKTRKLLHSRTVFSQGFLRKDGLIDIVGSIKDTVITANIFRYSHLSVNI